MSDIFDSNLDDSTEQPVEQLNDAVDEVGMTSQGDLVVDDGKKKRNLAFNVFDAMLLLSLIFVSLATMLLLWELSKFGNIFSAWNTSEIGK